MASKRKMSGARSARLSDTASIAGSAALGVHSSEESMHHSVSVRPIANGYLRSESRHGPDGSSHRETFHRVKPPLAPSAPRGGDPGHMAGAATMAGAKKCLGCE